MIADIADLILKSGRSGVELALFVLLPVMIVMLTTMRLLEGWGVLDRMVAMVAPLLRPFGLPGLGVFAMLQVTFVSFAAPVATLALMDKGGASRRHIAATFAMVLAMAQANVTFPMAALNLDLGLTLIASLIGGLIAAFSTYHIFARALPERDDCTPLTAPHTRGDSTKGLVKIINAAGTEAFKISIGALPMLVIALVFVNALRQSGGVEVIGAALSPLLQTLDLPAETALLAVTKFIAGGTAMMGVAVDLMDEGRLSIYVFNRLSGFLIHPYDVAGVAILITAGSRVAEVVKPALLGAAIGILVRSLIHGLVYSHHI